MDWYAEEPRVLIDLIDAKPPIRLRTVAGIALGAALLLLLATLATGRSWDEALFATAAAAAIVLSRYPGDLINLVLNRGPKPVVGHIYDVGIRFRGEDWIYWSSIDRIEEIASFKPAIFQFQLLIGMEHGPASHLRSRPLLVSAPSAIKQRRIHEVLSSCTSVVWKADSLFPAA